MHQWYWCAPFNYYYCCSSATYPVVKGNKGTGLSESEKLGEFSMPAKVVWVSNFQHKNNHQPKSVMIYKYKFYRANIALATMVNITCYLVIYAKDQLKYITTTRDSLQLVGQNLKSKTDNYSNNKNWGFPKGGNSYLWSRTTEWYRNKLLYHGNGVFVLWGKSSKGRQSSNNFKNLSDRYYSRGVTKITKPLVHLRNELLPEPHIFAWAYFAHHIQKKGTPVASLAFARLLTKVALQQPQAHECELYNSARASEQGQQMKIKRELSVAIECSYKQLFDINIYKSAYQQLKSNPGYFTEGTDNETLDGISLEWAQDVINQMKNRNFQFKPSLKVYIKKNNTLTNGKLRPIGIPSTRDIIIQQALRMILEYIYEPLFLNTSHGFRPKRSTTTALYEIKKWKGITWMINGDLTGYFDNIDHHILASLLQKQIKDKNLMDLYWKLVNAGYVNDGNLTRTNIGESTFSCAMSLFVACASGSPQEVKEEYKQKSTITRYETVAQAWKVKEGGVLSPLLSNIYLHEFDLFMNSLIEKYSNWDKRVSKANPTYIRLRKKISSLSGISGLSGLSGLCGDVQLCTQEHRRRNRISRWSNKKVLLDLKAILRKTSSVIRDDSTATKIYYNRYADEWVVGIRGSLNLAKTIKEEIIDFINNTLKIKLSEEKTKKQTATLTNKNTATLTIKNTQTAMLTQKQIQIKTQTFTKSHTKISHLESEKVKYLGFLISKRKRRYTESQILNVKSGKDNKGNKGKTKINRRPSYTSVIVEAPIDTLINKLVEQGYAWKGYKPKPRAVTKWIFMKPEDIILRFNYVIRGILSYYSVVENRNQFSYILWLLKFSAVFTLSRKLNLSPKQIFKKYGNHLTINFIRKNEKRSIKLFKPNTLTRDRTLN